MIATPYICIVPLSDGGPFWQLARKSVLLNFPLVFGYDALDKRASVSRRFLSAIDTNTLRVKIFCRRRVPQKTQISLRQRNEPVTEHEKSKWPIFRITTATAWVLLLGCNYCYYHHH